MCDRVFASKECCVVHWGHPAAVPLGLGNAATDSLIAHSDEVVPCPAIVAAAGFGNWSVVGTHRLIRLYRPVWLQADSSWFQNKFVRNVKMCKVYLHPLQRSLIQWRSRLDTETHISLSLFICHECVVARLSCFTSVSYSVSHAEVVDLRNIYILSYSSKKNDEPRSEFHTE
jgi:hypothetical protein